MNQFATLIQVLETSPECLDEVARSVGLLPGIPRVRNYTAQEISQLTRGVARMLLEALRDQEPHFQRIFIGSAIPAFVHQGESPDNLVQWNVTYVTMLSRVLVRHVSPGELEAFNAWFAVYAGRLVADIVASASSTLALLGEKSS